MIHSDPLPIMTQTVANSGSIYNNYRNPTTSRLTLEQQYADTMNRMIPQQNQQSNPYSDYLETLNSCTNLTQRKIQEDQRYHEIYAQCQSALLHEAFSQVMPAVLSTQQGRTLFERLNSTTQILKEEYTQQEIQREKQLEDREKATEQEKQQLESQKQEIAAMLAQIRELQQTFPQTIPTPSQQASVQSLHSSSVHSPSPQQNASQGIVEPVVATQNNSQNQNNQQNQSKYQNYNNRKNNKPQSNGGSLE